MQIHRAYIMINVLPGLTEKVIALLCEIEEIKTLDSCWGKPDIIALAETSNQEALTQLVLTRIHPIDGVVQTDTHLVYQMVRNRLTHA